MKLISAFAAGSLFAIGLGLAGMLRPENIQAFLDFAGAWDPTLMFVMGGATTVYFVAFHLLRGDKPFLVASYSLPTNTIVSAGGTIVPIQVSSRPRTAMFTEPSMWPFAYSELSRRSMAQAPSRASASTSAGESAGGRSSDQATRGGPLRFMPTL